MKKAICMILALALIAVLFGCNQQPSGPGVATEPATNPPTDPTNPPTDPTNPPTDPTNPPTDPTDPSEPTTNNNLGFDEEGFYDIVIKP